MSHRRTHLALSLLVVLLVLLSLLPGTPAPLRTPVAQATGSSLEYLWSALALNQTYSLAWGDVDGDGALDLVVGNLDTPNQLYRNQGGTLVLDSTWTPAAQSTYYLRSLEPLRCIAFYCVLLRKDVIPVILCVYAHSCESHPRCTLSSTPASTDLTHALPRWMQRRSPPRTCITSRSTPRGRHLSSGATSSPIRVSPKTCAPMRRTAPFPQR